IVGKGRGNAGIPDGQSDVQPRSLATGATGFLRTRTGARPASGYRLEAGGSVDGRGAGVLRRGILPRASAPHDRTVPPLRGTARQTPEERRWAERPLAGRVFLDRRRARPAGVAQARLDRSVLFRTCRANPRARRKRPP